uniref:Hypoxanthine phosphoribosyltransferase n=1 Tax=Plectus sambesii TaxID=2011161 RepID=A0A914VNT4_9BILA
MGRLNVALLRYLLKEDFRILTAIEMGMKNHELVPTELIASVANIHHGSVAKRLRDLAEHRLVSHERGRRYDGYRLTNLGYDYLALKAFASRDAVMSVGNQIGVGKESDVYLATDAVPQEIVLKFHRLGRTSFRKIKEKQIIGMSSLSELTDQNVLVVDDIVDSGLTMAYLLNVVNELKPKSVTTVVLLDKRVPKRAAQIKPDFLAFEIPNKFVVGYGLDYNQKFRDLNHVCVMSASGIEKYKND